MDRGPFLRAKYFIDDMADIANSDTEEEEWYEDEGVSGIIVRAQPEAKTDLFV